MAGSPESRTEKYFAEAVKQTSLNLVTMVMVLCVTTSDNLHCKPSLEMRTAEFDILVERSNSQELLESSEGTKHKYSDIFPNP